MDKKIKILIPLFYDYYLYNYLYELGQKLIENNCDVSYFTFDQKVKKKNLKYKDIKVFYGPKIIKFLMNRSTYFFFRFFLWIFSYIWSQKLKKKFNFVILPTDTKPVWYCMGFFIRSLTIQISTNMMNLKLHKRQINRIARRDYFDKIMGFSSSIFNVEGLGSSQNLLVPGIEFKKSYERLFKKNNKTKKIFVIGMPSYEKVLSIKEKWNEKKRRIFLSKLSINYKKDIYTFFLTYSEYDDIKINEIFMVINEIKKEKKNFFFLLIFHPKTKKKYFIKINDRLKSKNKNYKLVVGTGNEIFNTKIILSSYLLLQKQSTVGFLIMLLKKPVISYNLLKTNYEDDMYKIMGASLHCENIYTLKKSLNNLTKKTINLLKNKQDKASKKYCLSSDSPLQNVVDVIKKINMN